MCEISFRGTGFTGQRRPAAAILRGMTTRSIGRAARALALFAALAGCAKMAQNDRYTPPPNDGSVPANPSDMSDNPPIVPN